MKKVYFVTGSQDLYGEECLDNVAKDSKVIAKYLDKKIEGVKICFSQYGNEPFKPFRREIFSSAIEKEGSLAYAVNAFFIYHSLVFFPFNKRKSRNYRNHCESRNGCA